MAKPNAGRVKLSLLDPELRELILAKIDEKQLDAIIGEDLSVIRQGIDTKANKEDVYTKGDIDGMTTIPHTEFLDGGSFLDTYSSQTATVDGGEF